MVIKDGPMYIPIPKNYVGMVPKVTVGGTDITHLIDDSEFTKAVTTGTGIFTAKVKNPGGRYTGDFSAGDDVKFYLDFSAGTTLRFWGRLDKPEDNLSRAGQYLTLTGRHRSYIVNETNICHETSTTECGALLKEIIDKLISQSGVTFTYTNVATTSPTKSMPASWNEKPFWECVQEICEFSGYECYVDDDLDFHFFEENTITNTTDYIADVNTLQNPKWGTDDARTITRVTAHGKDDAGQPIRYTAFASDEGDIKREGAPVYDASANTYEKVKSAAVAALNVQTNIPPESKLTTKGLETLNPGDNIIVLLPRQQIAGWFKVVEFTHMFGVRGFRTITVFEKDEVNQASIVAKTMKSLGKNVTLENPNKMLETYNFTFTDSTNIALKTNTDVSDGFLKLKAGFTSGKMLSRIRKTTKNATYFEPKYAGADLAGAIIKASAQGGSSGSMVTLTRNTKTTIPVAKRGKNIVVEVELKSTSTEPNPAMDSLSLGIDF